MAEASKQGLKISPLTGEELDERVADLARTPASVIAKTETYTGPMK